MGGGGIELVLEQQNPLTELLISQHFPGIERYWKNRTGWGGVKFYQLSSPNLLIFPPPPFLWYVFFTVTCVGVLLAFVWALLSVTGTASRSSSGARMNIAVCCDLFRTCSIIFYVFILSLRWFLSGSCFFWFNPLVNLVLYFI